MWWHSVTMDMCLLPFLELNGCLQTSDLSSCKLYNFKGTWPNAIFENELESNKVQMNACSALPLPVFNVSIR